MGSKRELAARTTEPGKITTAPRSASSVGAKHLMALAESPMAVQEIIRYAKSMAEENETLKALRLIDADGLPIKVSPDEPMRVQIIRLAAAEAMSTGTHPSAARDRLTALKVLNDTMKNADNAYSNSLRAMLTGAQVAVNAQRAVDLNTIADREAVPYDLISQLHDPASGCDATAVARILGLPIAIVEEALHDEAARISALGLTDVDMTYDIDADTL